MDDSAANPASYGDAFADVYDLLYDEPGDTAGAVQAVAELAGASGRVLEVGAGTGRIAIPLASRVAEVVALDSSGAMLERLRAKPGASPVVTVRADAAALSARAHPALAEVFDVVLVARNTLFSVWPSGGEVACLAGLAAVMAPHGRLVVDLEVPQGAGGRSSEVRRVAGRELVLRWHHRPGERLVRCSLVDGRGVTRAWDVRYAEPALLDGWAVEAGLRLVERRAAWSGGAPDPSAVRHVSIYAHHANGEGAGSGTVPHVTDVAPNAK